MRKFIGITTTLLAVVFSCAAQELRSVQYTNATKLLFPRGILWSNLAEGTNILFDLSDGKLRINSTAAGTTNVGEVSTAQLLTVSNLLWQTIITNDNFTSNALYTLILGVGGDTNGYTSNQVWMLASSLDSGLSNGLMTVITSNTDGINAPTATNIVAGMRPAWRMLRPSYYVDSVNGSDSNNGTNPAAPFLTIAKLTNTIGASASDVSVYLARGSHWREELVLGDRVDVRAYGAGPRPILDASTVATNSLFVTNASAPGLWKYTLTLQGGGVSTILQVVENGTQLYQSNAPAATAAGCYHSTNDPTAASVQSVYLVSLDGSAPTNNGKVYEIAVRNYGLYVGTDSYVEGIHTRNNMHNNGSLEARRRSTVRDCLAENGTKHNLFVASGLVEDCVAWKSTFASASTMFISHDTVDSQSVIYRRCKAIGADYPRLSDATAYYAHDAGSGYSFTLLEDCAAYNVQSFASMAIQLNGVSVFNRCTGVGMYLGGITTYNGTNVFLDCAFLDSNTRQLASDSCRFFDLGGYNLLHGVTAATKTNGITIFSSLANSTIDVRDSFLSSTGGKFLHTTGSNIAASVSNTIATGHGFLYTLLTNSRISSAGMNVYNVSSGNLTVGGTNFATFAAYVSALGTDTTSSTNDVALIGYPSLGNFTYRTDSIAVTNKSGPGWRPVALPSLKQLSQIVQMPQKTFTGANPSTVTNANLAPYLLRTNDTAYTLRLSGNTTNSGGTYFVIDAANTVYLIANKQATNHNGSIMLQQGGTEKLSLKLPAAGNGLGQLYSAGPLEIYSGINSLKTMSYDLSLMDNTGSRYNLYIDYFGKVGIGTNSPQRKLHVHGDTEINGALYVGSTNLHALAAAGGSGLQITNGSNITFATNTPNVVTISASITGGTNFNGIIVTNTARVGALEIVSTNAGRLDIKGEGGTSTNITLDGSSGTVTATGFAGSGAGLTDLPTGTDTNTVNTMASNRVSVAAGSGVTVSSSGSDYRQTFTVSASATAAAVSNVIVSSTAPVVLDLASFQIFKCLLLTNSSFVFSNQGANLSRANVLLQQDTNGQRTTEFSVAGGLLQTNENLQATTNANALDLLEVSSSYFSTNLIAWWPSDFSPRVAATNSLAGVITQTNALAPTFSPNGGLLAGGSTNVTITSAGNMVYWTTNNDTPTTNITGIASGSMVTISTTNYPLKAIAWTNDGYRLPSDVASATFTNAPASSPAVWFTNSTAPQMFFDPDSLAGTSGDAITSWTDLASSVVVTNYPTGFGPYLTNSALNGHNLLTFTSNALMRTTSTLSKANPRTYVLVARMRSSINQYWFDWTTGNQHLIKYYSSRVYMAGTGMDLGGVSGNKWVFLAAVYNGASSALYAGTNAVLTGDSGAFTGTGQMTIGAYGAVSSLSQPANSDYAVFAVFDSALSELEVNTIRTNCMARFNLSL